MPEIRKGHGFGFFYILFYMCLHSLLSELSFRQGFETCLRIVSEGNAWFGFPGGRVGISSRRDLAQSEPLALTAPRWGSSVKARVGQCGAFWGFFGQQPRAEQESVCQSSFSAGVNGSSCSHWWQWHRERVTLNVPYLTPSLRGHRAEWPLLTAHVWGEKRIKPLQFPPAKNPWRFQLGSKP